jgi:Fic family protein
MQELCQSLVYAGEQVGLLSGAMAHLNLALIHPFKDGNGRTARVLQSLVLAQSEPLGSVFLSIEEFLAAHTKDYYAVLAEVGGGVWNPKVNAKPWIRFVLNAHYRQAEQVRVNAAQLNASWNEVAQLVENLGLHERVVSPLVHVETGNKLTNQLYRTLVLEAGDSISTLTASRDLADLVEARLLVALGDTRARSYVAGPALEQITQLLAGKFSTRRLNKLF